jgi:quercetin dioxygenase-like cupin family protein
MTKFRLEEMTKGWFVGDFEPSVLRTPSAEVGVKRYQAGDREPWHYHKIATEVTLVLEGEVMMNGARHFPADIIRLEPGEGTDFLAVTDATTVVVKMPSVIDDKYLG